MELYSNQYFIKRKSKGSVDDAVSNWPECTLNDEFSLFYHSSLQVKETANCVGKLIILGPHFSVIHDNLADFHRELEKTTNIDEVQRLTSFLSGRYVVFFISQEQVHLYADALSLRQVYYCHDSDYIVASDINILARFNDLLEQRNEDMDDDAFEFYKTDFLLKKNCWIGNDTIYKKIKKLPPNYQLNLCELSTSRYWPKTCISSTSTKEAAKLIDSYLRRVLKQIADVKKLSIAVTAGYDSRVMLAISHSLDIDAHYFIDKKESMAEDDTDIVVGKKLVSSIGQHFIINKHQDSLDHIPKEFIDIYKESCFYSGETQLSTVYFYSKNFSNYINICGVGEVGRSRFGVNSFKPTPAFLAYKYGYTKSAYATEKSAEWLRDSAETCQKYNINPYTLYYWEVDLGNWGAVGNSESDIAIEELNPFNSHAIFEQMLGVNDNDTKLRDNLLFEQIIAQSNPALNNVPINPTNGFIPLLKRHLMNSSLYQYIDYLKFRLTR